MNNFKKFVAVLLGVVMACVFATSAFAASTSDKAAAIKSEMANYGLTGFDAVIDSLNDTQLQVSSIIAARWRRRSARLSLTRTITTPLKIRLPT